MARSGSGGFRCKSSGLSRRTGEGGKEGEEGGRGARRGGRGEERERAGARARERERETETETDRQTDREGGRETKLLGTPGSVRTHEHPVKITVCREGMAPKPIPSICRQPFREMYFKFPSWERDERPTEVT